MAENLTSHTDKTRRLLASDESTFDTLARARFERMMQRFQVVTPITLSGEVDLLTFSSSLEQAIHALGEEPDSVDVNRADYLLIVDNGVDKLPLKKEMLAALSACVEVRPGLNAIILSQKAGLFLSLNIVLQLAGIEVLYAENVDSLLDKMLFIDRFVINGNFIPGESEGNIKSIFHSLIGNQEES